MIDKERTIPIEVKKLEAITRRIPDFHPKRPLIIEELGKRRSGYYGESSLDYYLSFLPDKPYRILNGLRLKNNHSHYFQMDTLILSPFFLTIIEVKNYSGMITFDSHFNQLIQTKGEMERAFDDPLSQVSRHQVQFKDWLSSNKFPDIPIIPLVVISNPSTIIKTVGNSKHFKAITRGGNVISKIEKLEKVYKEGILSKKELTKLSKRLLKMHTPIEYDVLKIFKINKTELLTGVHCPNCFSLPMTKVHAKWMCHCCQFSSKTAHLDSLRDYALLISPTITNQKMRDFLHLPSRTIATNILQSMNLSYTGNGKARQYILPRIDI